MINAKHLEIIKNLVKAGYKYSEYLACCETYNITPCHEKFYK